MTYAGFVWECSCGHVEYSEHPPEECPQCSTLDSFVKLPEEILAEVRQEGKMRETEDVKQAAVEVILRQIPEWAAEAALKKMESSDGPGLKCSCSD